jgi:hypothetical protein
MNNDATWDDVPQSEIDKELNYWQSKRKTVVWLVPCRYSDGEATCSGTLEFPYSNPKRRQYNLTSGWERQF